MVTNDLAERNRWARSPDTSHCCFTLLLGLRMFTCQAPVGLERCECSGTALSSLPVASSGPKRLGVEGVTERLGAAQRGDVPAAVAAQAGGDGLPGARVRGRSGGLLCTLCLGTAASLIAVDVDSSSAGCGLLCMVGKASTQFLITEGV